MPTINVEYSLEVQATAEKLWDIIIDVKSWPDWQGTSFVRLAVPSPIREGSTFLAELGGVKWNITIVKADRPHRVVWIGQSMGLKGIHEWEFDEQAERTRVITRESMSGWTLISLFPIIRKGLAKTDKKWLADLKSRAESL
jgi:hypothetical protein